LTVTILASVDPLALEAASIGHIHHASAIFLIVLILTFVAAAIRVAENAVTMHFISVPGPLIHTAIAPSIAARALDVIVGEVTVVERSVTPRELALSLLASANVLALIGGSIAPRFDTLAVLLVIFPGTLVNRTVEVQVLSLAVGFIGAPLTDIDVAIGVDESADAMRLAVVPLALVQAAIEPHQATLAHSCLQVISPLTPIDDAIFHPVRFFRDECLLQTRHSGRIECTFPVVHLFHTTVEKECTLVYGIIEDSTHLVAIAQ